MAEVQYYVKEAFPASATLEFLQKSMSEQGLALHQKGSRSREGEA